MEYSPWNSQGQNTGEGNCSLLQGIFPTQGSKPGLLHCRQILYQLSHQGSPKPVVKVAHNFRPYPVYLPRDKATAQHPLPNFCCSLMALAFHVLLPPHTPFYNPMALTRVWVLITSAATHPSILAWRAPWIVQSMGSQELDMTEQLSQ